MLSATASLRALPLELGLNYAPGYRHPDRFSQGMERFHARPEFFSINKSQSSGFDSLQNYSFWFRFDEVLSSDHWIGAEIGRYYSPQITVNQLSRNHYRRDRMVSSRWSFNFHYFLLSYDYRRQVSRKLYADLGAGFGFLTYSRWHVNGWQMSGSSLKRYNSSHRARFGNIWRLQASLYRPLSDHFFIKGGFRFTYLQAIKFVGQLNDVNSEWYYAGDNGLVLLSDQEFLNIATQMALTNSYSPLNPIFNYTFLKNRASFTSGLSEIYFSVGVRFY